MPEEIVTENSADPTIVSTSTEKKVDEVTPSTVKEESKTFDKEYVESLRNEAASWRTKLREMETQFSSVQTQLKEFQDAQLTEQEKFTRDFEEAKTKATQFETQAREKDLALQIAMVAREEKIADIKAAVKLADRELIQYDNNGQVSNLADVVASLRTEYPSLFNVPAPVAPNPGTTNPAKAPSATKWTREDLKTMSPEKRVELLEKGELKHLL